MRTAFQKIFNFFKLLWRTVVRTFVKKKVIYTQDVDNDGKDEIVLDFNNQTESQNNQESLKGGENNDK